MTNYHIISDDYLKNNKQIKITINNEKIIDFIDIIEESKIYSSKSEKFDIMVIKFEKKNIYNYLKLDDNLLNENSEKLYEEKSIYIPHYPSGDKLSVSFGYGINKLDEYYIKHKCHTEQSSSGSPILNLKTNKLIGIHKGCITDKDKNAKYNIGILLKYPLNELNKNNKNEVYEKENKKELVLKNEINNHIIGEFDVKEDNQNIRIINSYGEWIREYKYEKYFILYENEKEIKENCEISINDKKIPFTYYYKFDKKGKHIIKFIFKEKIKNTSFMFDGCLFLENIDLSNFNTNNVSKIRHMFSGCLFLTNINLSNYNTENVIDMSGIFSYCPSLTNIDLSNFNKNNVTNMCFMFHRCKSLSSINLSNFNTSNVTNMRGMFCECSSLTNIDLSNFNTNNVFNMKEMFYGCSSLININLSNFTSKNVIEIDDMFHGCNKLIKNNIIVSDEKIKKLII